MNTFVNQEKKNTDPPIEDILADSVNLFNKAGMNDLANKWSIILENYQNHSKIKRK